MASTDSEAVKRQPSMTAYFNPFARSASSTAAVQDNPLHSASPYAANKQIRTTVNNFNRGPATSAHPVDDQPVVVPVEVLATETRARKRSSIIGYLFGGEEASAERESELVAHRPAYIDLSIETVPHGVKVLNEPDEFFGGGNYGAVGSKKPISGNE